MEANSPSSFTVELNLDEALVANDALVEILRNPMFRRLFGDAERIALGAIQCSLEKELVEPFLPNYRTLLESARKRVAGG